MGPPGWKWPTGLIAPAPGIPTATTRAGRDGGVLACASSGAPAGTSGYTGVGDAVVSVTDHLTQTATSNSARSRPGIFRAGARREPKVGATGERRTSLLAPWRLRRPLGS